MWEKGSVRTSGRDGVPDGTALEGERSLAAVAPHGRRGETENEPGAEAVRDAREGRRGEGVAFVDDDEAVAQGAEFGGRPARERLQERHVEPPRRAARTAADPSDFAFAQAEKLRETGDPLSLEGAAVHEHERGAAAERDHPGGENRFPEGRSRL